MSVVEAQECRVTSPAFSFPTYEDVSRSFE